MTSFSFPCPRFLQINGQIEGRTYVVDELIAGDNTPRMMGEIEDAREGEYLSILRKYNDTIADIHILHGRRIVGEPMTITILQDGKVLSMVKGLEMIVTKEDVRRFIASELDDPAHYAEDWDIISGFPEEESIM